MLSVEVGPENKKMSRCTRLVANGICNQCHLLTLRFRTSNAVLNKTSLGSKHSDCHALASTLRNCASAGFDDSAVAPLSNTRGALSEHITSWLPQTRSCVSHLGEIKTPAAEMSNFKAESLQEIILSAVERISAAFCSVCSECVSSALSELFYNSSSQTREAMPPRGRWEMSAGICDCHDAGKERH